MSRVFSIAVVALLLQLGCGASPQAQEAVSVYAAASLAEVMSALAERFEQQTGVAVAVNLASSGVLAQQIIAGAPADVFVSANRQWMDEVVGSGRARVDGVVEFAHNRLAVIVPVDSDLQPASLEDLLSPRFDRIAVGDPAHAPAGIYAREALEAAGVWQELEARVVPAVDVRAAIAYVGRGEVQAAIAYSTDARQVDGLRIALEIPPGLHSRVVYQAAVVAAPPAPGALANRFLVYLTSAEGRGIIRSFGFLTAED